MQGVFVAGQRPKSKKAVKEAIAAGYASQVQLERTSPMGREYDGPVDRMPEGEVAYFCGPDPYTDRRFYGQIVRRGDKVKVS